MTSKIRFYPAVPILRVGNLQASIDHYVSVLGFSLDWHEPGIICSLSRDRCALMLAQGDQGHAGSWTWIGVGNIVPLHEELRSRGAIVRLPPTNFPWAHEMQIEDPDRNVLRFGSEPLEGQPIGTWMDMLGRPWTASPDGKWTRSAP